MASFNLLISCPDRPGVVADVTGALFRIGGNVVEAQQFSDVSTGKFFQRIVFECAAGREEILRALGPSALRFEMTLRLDAAGRRKRVLILVSKFDHCLADLLYRQRIGELKMEVAAVASNHPKAALLHTNLRDIPHHHFPAEGDKSRQEEGIKALIDATKAELVVLARYMQILSDGLVQSLEGRCINIHHSFLPGFKGARPYHQAHERGVKMIGATAHFVTADLDEGPIIAQDVEQIGHADTPDDLVAKGRDIERRVLARAVALFLEDRVMINGAKTVVFAK